jgi:hypothetical protein
VVLSGARLNREGALLAQLRDACPLMTVRHSLAWFGLPRLSTCGPTCCVTARFQQQVASALTAAIAAFLRPA